MSVLASFHWTSDYVGVPHRDFGRDRSGIDCWGLARLVYREQRGIELPDYLGQYASTEEREQLQAIIAGGKASRPWVHHTDVPVPMDILIFRRGRLESHIGIALDERSMLHVAAGEHSKIERYDQGRWHRRLTTVCRHEALL